MRHSAKKFIYYNNYCKNRKKEKYGKGEIVLKKSKLGRITLFAALILMMLAIPSVAYEVTDWVESGNSYMINNVIIEVGSIGLNEEELNDSKVSISIYEWKNDKWEKVGTGWNLNLNDSSRSFKSAEGKNYTVGVLDFRGTRYGSVKLHMWTDADMTTSKHVTGFHDKVEGSGKPELVITKVVTPAGNITAGDIVTVQVYVNNTGKYDAKNVNIHDPYPENFIVTNATLDNTVNQTINKNTNNTYKVYQLKAIEPGTYTLKKTTVTAENNVGEKYDFEQKGNNIIIKVDEVAALIFSEQTLSGNTVDYQARTKINGSFAIRNTGTLPAQYIEVEFTIPQNATLSGKNITVTGNKASVYIDQLTPNNERIVEYTLAADYPGNYEIDAIYKYTYNGSQKNGTIESIKYRSIGNNTITSVMEYWYLIAIPIILILAVVLFFIKKRNEYRY